MTSSSPAPKAFLPPYPLAYDDPWTGLSGTPYNAVVEPGRGIRRSSVEQFCAWAYRVYGRDLDPSEVTGEMAYAFAEWAVGGAQAAPDVRHDLMGARSQDWAPMWDALARLTSRLGRAPTMFELYLALPKKYLRRMVPAGQHEHAAVRSRIRDFVQRFHVWVEQNPRGQKTYERWRDAKKKTGFRPATVSWDQIRVIIRPRTSLSSRSVLGMVRALRAAWNELGLTNSNPWVALSKDAASLVRRTPKVYEREATALHIQKLLKSPDTRTLEGARDFAVIAATVFWGLRATELVAVKRSDVLRMEDGQVRVRIASKTKGSDRFLLVTTRMQRAIERFSVLVEERESRAVGPMAKWASKVLAPDAPLFPSLFRWHRESMHLEAKRPLLPNAVYKILQIRDVEGAPRPTEIRAYVAKAMRLIKTARPEVWYFLGSKRTHNGRSANLEAVDRAILMFEAWMTQEAKLIW